MTIIMEIHLGNVLFGNIVIDINESTTKINEIKLILIYVLYRLFILILL